MRFYTFISLRPPAIFHTTTVPILLYLMQFANFHHLSNTLITYSNNILVLLLLKLLICPILTSLSRIKKPAAHLQFICQCGFFLSKFK